MSNSSQKKTSESTRPSVRPTSYSSEPERRRENKKPDAFKSIFTVITLMFIAELAYQLNYNIQVVMQYKDKMSDLDDDSIIIKKTLYLVVSLLPSIFVALYGLTLCFF